MFSAEKVFPGVTHLTDCMGVSMTLLEGEDSALLIDAGYGLEDVGAYVRSLTDRPVELILTHGHHDHILGARWFAGSRIAAEDLEEFRLRTGAAQREAVRGQAEAKGLAVPADFLSAAIPVPEPLTWTGRLGVMDCAGYDLGGLEVWVLHVPGHTPGSCVCYVPAYGLLLTGDDWNPCTWLWFPSSLPVRAWRHGMLNLLRELDAVSGVSAVLCSHQPKVRAGEELRDYLAYMTEERLAAAEPANLGDPEQNIRQVTDAARGWTLVFDAGKAEA